MGEKTSADAESVNQQSRMERTIKSKETVLDSDDDGSLQEEKNVHLTKKDEFFYLVGDKSSRIQHIDVNTKANADVNQCELISVDGFEGKCDTSTKIQDNDIYLKHVDTFHEPISDKKESGKIVLVNTVEQVKRTIDSSTNNILVDITGVNTDKNSNTHSFLFDRTFVNSDNVLNKDARVSISQEGASSNNLVQQRMDARNRWKRAARSVQLINHMTANIRLPTTLDEVWEQQQVTRDDAGGVGAAAFEGTKTEARTRSKGRKGMEGLIVRQNRGLITFLQDFYVACLKVCVIDVQSHYFYEGRIQKYPEFILMPLSFHYCPENSWTTAKRAAVCAI